MKTMFKKNGKRVLSAALCLLMAVMSLPLSAFAWTSEEGRSCTSSFGDYYVGLDGEYYRSQATMHTLVYNDDGSTYVKSYSSGNAKRKYLMKIDSLKDEIEALMPKKEETVINYSEKLEMLRFALSQYNAPEYFENGIPESVIDAYVEKLVVFEDHFEWYLRFGGNDPLKCRVNGKKDANPEVIFGDSLSSLTELEKHRLQ